MPWSARDVPGGSAGDPPERSRPCGRWKHYSRFRSWKVRSGKFHKGEREGTVSFAPICRDCEQKERNEKKNADRPRAIIEQRARAAASKAGKRFEFFWVEMNYQGLVPILRILMTPEGLCLNCGHKFVNERDIQIEHCEPPRFPQDWARLHARNLRLFCGSCNAAKGKKPFAKWLDDEEERRLSNLAQPREPRQPLLPGLPLFEHIKAG
jgi:hypothetical protein